MTLQALVLDTNSSYRDVSEDEVETEDEYEENFHEKRAKKRQPKQKGRIKPYSTLMQENDDEDDDVENNRNKNQRHRPPRPSLAGVRMSRAFAAPSAQRRRRRSSARFLRLSQSAHNNDDDEEDEESARNDGNLGDIYKRAIRMNAENKINANNSWSLKLIENIDKFLEDEEEKDSPTVLMEGHEPTVATAGFIETQDAAPPSSRVNFTKASCTLDASVKIYSYRVDDVHLTSYKVLANLNRSEQAPSTQPRPTTSETTTEDPGDNEQNVPSTAVSTTRTLESAAQLNVDSLDSAFDIDPLFHKLSKTFQEGGARGLLLVNLSTHQGQVVFDSSSAAIESNREPAEEGNVDLGGFRPKVPEYLDTLDELPLVPQLSSLRADYDALDEEGFVDYGAIIPKKRRRFDYAAGEEEEIEADKSIHQEAMERSQRGQSVTMDEDDDVYAPDDMGGGDDGWDDHEIGGLDPFMIEADENGTRYSSISFRDSTEFASAGGNAATTSLLNALTEAETLWAQSDLEYFSEKTVGNLWAGAAHWKRSVRKGASAEPKKSKPKVSASTRRTLVNLSLIPDMSKILEKAKKTSSMQWSHAAVQKHGKNENVLPLDAGLGIDQLSKLFLRPQQTVGPKTVHTKTVGFAESTHEWAPDDFGVDDYDGNDDGPAFIPAGPYSEDDDEVVLPELEGIRKVEKVQVGYATVAKKVDVKRLKSELWDEVEDQLQVVEEVSFQDAVQHMEESKSQQDVTLPFYFISILHLANEKCLGLESRGLDDFCIVQGKESLHV